MIISYTNFMLNKNLHTLVSEKEFDQLRTEAFKRRVSISVVVREAVKLYFQKSKESKK